MSRRSLHERIGTNAADRIFQMRAAERSEEDKGLREPGQPSQAETLITQELGRSPFTPEERARIRTLLGMDPRVDVIGMDGDES